MLMSNFLSSLHILEISPLSDVGLVKIFSHSVGCLFLLLTVSFALQKFLSFRKFHLFIVALRVCATGVIFRKWSHVPMHWRLLPTFSSIRFCVVRFILRSLIHLDLSFVHGDKFECSSSLAVREMKIKITLRYHLTPVRWTKIKNTNDAYAGEDVQEGEHSSIAGEKENLYNHFGNQYGGFSENWQSTYLRIQQYHS